MLSITRYYIKNLCLVPLVKFIWHCETENANIHHKLLPTDCIDLIMNFTDNMIYEVGTQKIIAPAFHVNGLRDSYSYVHQTGTIHLWGISFYSFGLFPFVNQSLENIQNKITDLFTLSASLTHKLKAAVSCGVIHNIPENIESALLLELNISKVYMNKTNLIHDFIETEEKSAILSFCIEHEINIKTLERIVLQYTGYTPKKLRRIKRFQTVSNQLVHSDPVSLASISYDNDFSDQTHFIKEFKKFSGESPSIFKQQKDTIKEILKYRYI